MILESRFGGVQASSVLQPGTGVCNQASWESTLRAYSSPNYGCLLPSILGAHASSVLRSCAGVCQAKIPSL